MVLRGHTSAITVTTFTSDNRNVLSGSNDGSVRVWDRESGQCLRTIGGYTAALSDLDWSADGTRLASGGADCLVTIWHTASATLLNVLSGHQWMVQGVAWTPDGQFLVSGGYDSIGLWDATTGIRLQRLHVSEGDDTLFQGVAWSPDGTLLACGTYLHGVQVWEMHTHPSLGWADTAANLNSSRGLESRWHAAGRWGR